MYRSGKWARQVIALQREDGSWGDFHSLSVAGGSKMTTEQALRRLEYLGFTAQDECIRRALSYMDDCLCGRRSIPDRREKVHDWDVFTHMILSARIRRFTRENPRANAVAQQWARLTEAAFAGGAFDREAYRTAYQEHLRPCGGRIISLENFYPVSLLAGELSPRTQQAFVRHLLESEGGIYYIYDRPLRELPERFQSREASRYLAAMELLADYPAAREELSFAADWLEEHRLPGGGWDMGREVNDKVYFPLSDSWRREEERIRDCTVRISALMNKLRPRPEGRYHP